MQAIESGGWIFWVGWLATTSAVTGCFNEWREADAESGTAKLSRNDASFFLRLAMDLVDPQEKDLMGRHGEILRERSQIQKTAQDQERHLAFNRSELAKRIELPGEAPVDGLFANQILQVAQAKRESLQRLLDEFRSQSNVANLETEHARLGEELAGAASTLREKESFLATGRSFFDRTACSWVDVYRRYSGRYSLFGLVGRLKNEGLPVTRQPEAVRCPVLSEAFGLGSH